MLAFYYEIKYNLIRQFRYKLSFASNILFNLIMFASMLSLNKNMYVEETSLVSYSGILAFTTYLFWNYGSMLISANVSHLSGELISGIFETKLQSKIDIIWLLFAKMLSSLILCIGVQLIVFTILIVCRIIPVTFIKYYFVIIIIYMPGLLGVFGVSLILCGLTFKFKVLGAVSSFYPIILFIINAFYTEGNVLIHILIPYILGMEISKSYILSKCISLRQIGLYVFINILWGVIGLCMFKILLYRTKKVGYFNAY